MKKTRIIAVVDEDYHPDDLPGLVKQLLSPLYPESITIEYFQVDEPDMELTGTTCVDAVDGSTTFTDLGMKLRGSL